MSVEGSFCGKEKGRGGGGGGKPLDKKKKCCGGEKNVKKKRNVEHVGEGRMRAIEQLFQRGKGTWWSGKHGFCSMTAVKGKGEGGKRGKWPERTFHKLRTTTRRSRKEAFRREYKKFLLFGKENSPR